jgi:hypothetical protein
MDCEAGGPEAPMLVMGSGGSRRGALDILCVGMQGHLRSASVAQLMIFGCIEANCKAMFNEHGQG